MLNSMDYVEEELKFNREEHKIIMQELKTLGDKFEELALEVRGLPEKILEKADRRYASKTTERAVYTLIGALCLTVVYAIVEVVTKR